MESVPQADAVVYRLALPTDRRAVAVLPPSSSLRLDAGGKVETVVPMATVRVEVAVEQSVLLREEVTKVEWMVRYAAAIVLQHHQGM